MNIILYVKLFFFLILFRKVKLEDDIIEENIISSISIDVGNKTIEEQISFFGINEYKSYLLKYHVRTNYICYLQYYYNFLYKKVIKICNGELNKNESINLLFVDDELLVFDYYYNFLHIFNSLTI